MGNGTDEHLILFPQYEELSNEVKKLRAELAMLVMERDELKPVECKTMKWHIFFHSVRLNARRMSFNALFCV